MVVFGNDSYKYSNIQFLVSKNRPMTNMALFGVACLANDLAQFIKATVVSLKFVYYNRVALALLVN